MSTPVQLKRVCRMIDERAGDCVDLPLLSVSIHEGVVPRSQLTSDEPRAEDLSAYKVCRPRDLVLNRMRAFHGGVGMTRESGIVSPDYIVLRTASAADPRYLHYMFRSAWFVGQMTARLRGIGAADQGNVRTPRINWGDLREIVVRLPSAAVQAAIADFLDSETARIDALISRRSIALALLREHVKSATAELIDDAGRPVPFRYVVRYREGPGIMAVDFRDSGVPLLRVANLVSGHVVLDGCGYLDPQMVEGRWPQFRVRVGDYILSASARMGSISVVDDPALTGAIPYTGLIILRAARADVDMEYVAAFLSSPQFFAQIDQMKTGVGIEHFGPTHLDCVHMPLPALGRQREIAAEVRRVEDRCGAATSAINRQIALLQERKQALITAAVTGQLDVTEGAA